jgi:hypothetical protein
MNPTLRTKSLFAWSMKYIYRIGGLVSALVLVVGPPVFAQDYDRQVKLLSVVYLGQHFSTMCAIERPTFLDETRGPLGPMSVYAQHIKEEVMSGLPPEQISSVLVQAANAARSGARAKLAEFAVGPATVDKARLLNWCETTAKPYALKIMAMHDHQHDLFRCDRPGKSDQGLWLRDCASFFGPDDKQLYGR